MIEFNGRLSGLAEKRFLKRAADFAQNMMLAVMQFLLPPCIYFSAQKGTWLYIGGYLALVVSITLLLRIPKSKKERIAIMPKRIFIEDDLITCVADRYTEARMVCDVKLVRDFGEFFELVFPFGKYSEKFICQKNLLTKGTLEEFEALFEDKIVRVN